MKFGNVYFECQFRLHFKYLKYMKHGHNDYDVLIELMHLKEVVSIVVSNATLVDDVISTTSRTHLRCKDCLKSKLLIWKHVYH